MMTVEIVLAILVSMIAIAAPLEIYRRYTVILTHGRSGVFYSADRAIAEMLKFASDSCEDSPIVLVSRRGSVVFSWWESGHPFHVHATGCFEERQAELTARLGRCLNNQPTQSIQVVA